MDFPLQKPQSADRSSSESDSSSHDENEDHENNAHETGSPDQSTFSDSDDASASSGDAVSVKGDNAEPEVTRPETLPIDEELAAQIRQYVTSISRIADAVIENPQTGRWALQTTAATLKRQLSEIRAIHRASAATSSGAQGQAPVPQQEPEVRRLQQQSQPQEQQPPPQPPEPQQPPPLQEEPETQLSPQPMQPPEPPQPAPALPRKTILINRRQRHMSLSTLTAVREHPNEQDDKAAETDQLPQPSQSYLNKRRGSQPARPNTYFNPEEQRLIFARYGRRPSI